MIVFGRVPAVQLFADGAVRMDGDGDVELVDQLVEAVEAVGAGVGGEKADAEPAGELEEPAVGVVVLGEALDAERDRRDPIFFEEGACRPDLRLGRRGRDMAAIELNVADAEHLHLLEGTFEGEIADSCSSGCRR